ncbi:putative Zinc finger, SWIM-type [Dioscorea sansibarensis]
MMARWDEILTLPVQNPSTPEFSAMDLVWSRVGGWREKIDRLALIPFSRVNDFVRGESNNKECPTRFHVEARRRRPLEMGYKPKVDGILEYILYWCSFGPDDHRKGGVVRPSRNYAAKRKTPAGRPNTKRDKKGSPCHGPSDKKAAGTCAMFAPYISDELRLQILSLLYVGIPVETIMQRHTEIVEKQGGPCNRDDLLTHRYVRRLERKIRRSTYELDSVDDASVALWVENHQDHVFFYEDFSDSEPFILGIQTEWQLQQMLRFGNGSIVASDSSFGTNKLKYPIYTLLVFGSNNNAIPVAWIITPSFARGEMHRWLGALYDRVRTKDPTWKLGGFIIDDPAADVLMIREVFQCSVLISFWRVRHAWHKNLIDKCIETNICAEMSKRLGEAVSHVCRGTGDMQLFEAFMEDFVDCSSFMDYFKAVWFPRIGAWVDVLKALPLATTEISAAIECYHHLLKLRLLNEKDSNVYQRADWLVDKLGTKVHSYYWLDEFTGRENFARYWKDEWKSGLTSWRRALQIPDSDVIVDGKYAKVISHKREGKVHTILNPGCELAICDCRWSRMGNLCKHVIKSTKVFRDKGLAAPSTSLFEFNQALTSILRRPPHDSLSRDHAIALVVGIQSQLNGLFDLVKVRTTSSTSVQAAANSGLSASDEPIDADTNMIHENHSVSENVCGDGRSGIDFFPREDNVSCGANGVVDDNLLHPSE